MKLYNRFKIILFFSVLNQLSETANSQNYFGMWEGHSGISSGWQLPLKIVLEINKDTDSTLSGTSHIYYKSNKYEHYIVKGLINRNTQSMVISEISVLSVKLGFLHTNKLGTYFLKLNCFDTICNLKGDWRPNSSTPFASKSINTFFKKIQSNSNDSPSLKTIDKIEELNVQKRISDIQSLIEVDSKKFDSINIKLYDNGEIDQDSISLYLDDSILISKRQISVDPIELNFPILKLNSFSKLKLIAESLGTIPPCTAVMIITIGKKRYEVNLTSNFEKNGVVEFFLK